MPVAAGFAFLSKYQGVPGDGASHNVVRRFMLHNCETEIFKEHRHFLCGAGSKETPRFCRMVGREGNQYQPAFAAEFRDVASREEAVFVRQMHQHRDGHDGVKPSITRCAVRRVDRETSFNQLRPCCGQRKAQKFRRAAEVLRFRNHRVRAVGCRDVGAERRHKTGVPPRAAAQFHHAHPAANPAG